MGPRELGVCFENLKVVGVASRNTYQPTLGSILNPLNILRTIQGIRHPQLRDILSGFEGVVRPGEMLCEFFLFHFSVPRTVLSTSSSLSEKWFLEPPAQDARPSSKSSLTNVTNTTQLKVPCASTLFHLRTLRGAIAATSSTALRTIFTSQPSLWSKLSSLLL